MTQKLTKGKQRINTPLGFACIHSTSNNTIITMTDTSGNVLAWASAGSCGFKGSRKKTAYAAQVTARNVTLKALKLGLKKVGIILKGAGNGREIAIKGIYATGLDIISIEDKTGVPHNGCRAPKRRRL